MNSPNASVDLSMVKAALSDAIASGVGTEDLIQTMRNSGLNQITSIKMLRDLTGLPLGEAKEIVHYSKAWADRKEVNEAFHEAAFQAAHELGFVETNG